MSILHRRKVAQERREERQERERQEHERQPQTVAELITELEAMARRQDGEHKP